MKYKFIMKITYTNGKKEIIKFKEDDLYSEEGDFIQCIFDDKPHRFINKRLIKEFLIE